MADDEPLRAVGGEDGVNSCSGVRRGAPCSSLARTASASGSRWMRPRYHSGPSGSSRIVGWPLSPAAIAAATRRLISSIGSFEYSPRARRA